MLTKLAQGFSFLLKTGEDVVSPLYEGITIIGPYAISMVLVLSIFWAVFLGVKYTKTDDPAERANLHQVLVNFIVGAFIVLVLISVLYAIRGSLVNFINA